MPIFEGLIAFFLIKSRLGAIVMQVICTCTHTIHGHRHMCQDISRKIFGDYNFHVIKIQNYIYIYEKGSD